MADAAAPAEEEGDAMEVVVRRRRKRKKQRQEHRRLQQGKGDKERAGTTQKEGHGGDKKLVKKRGQEQQSSHNSSKAWTRKEESSHGLRRRRARTRSGERKPEKQPAPAGKGAASAHEHSAGETSGTVHVKVEAEETQTLNAVMAELEEEEALLRGAMQQFSALHAHQLHLQEDLCQDFGQMRTVSQEFVRIPNRCMGVLCGRNMRKIKDLSQEHDCQIVVPPRSEDPDGVALVTLVGTAAATQACAKAIDSLVHRFLAQERRRQQRTASSPSNGSKQDSHDVADTPRLPATKGVTHHIFIDYSNIMAGAKAAMTSGPDVRDREVHLRSDMFLDLLTRERAIGQCELIGTHIPRLVQAEARSRGFVVRSFERRAAEVLVDDKLHAQVLQCLLQVRHRGHTHHHQHCQRDNCDKEDAVSVTSEVSQAEQQPHVLTLVTGDGNDNSGNNSTSFLKCAALALDEGWMVEIVSWNCNLSENFVSLQSKHPSQVRLISLDTFTDKLLRHKMHA